MPVSTCHWKTRAYALSTRQGGLSARQKASEPEILIGWFRGLGLAVTRIGLEAGPLSQWLYAGMRDAGLAVELFETRHVRDAFKAMPVKTDRKDARGPRRRDEPARGAARLSAEGRPTALTAKPQANKKDLHRPLCAPTMIWRMRLPGRRSAPSPRR
jgi:hypothetical protein